ncbi:AAA family ATPase [Mesorhizobium sp. WSM2239]|uniref:AAA family ATPase n=2 Tax=unclassified Mesorhizobium TaxID=325217 RepID=A0AAU8D5G1_9HYPH
MQQKFTKVEFHRFKAFKNFRIDLRHFNILVGPNNAGKSTVLSAFRILAAALRRASAKGAVLVRGPAGMVYGHEVDLRTISVAEENIFFDYDDEEPAFVKFTITNANTLTLYFPEQGVCYLIPDAQGKNYYSPSAFKKHFNSKIGFVPILGPVDHHEQLYQEEAARLALFSYRAARNFRNIWYHFPDRFDDFRAALQQTWPGMDIEPPEVDNSHEKPLLHMYCPEDRRPREIFWSGFGFQVWCQMLTHVIQSKDASLFLIDEPDIYLHSELQRQLLSILRNLGPDILLATHSTEMIVEAETNDIVLINKRRSSGKRIKDPSQLATVFSDLGSNLNPILTQLAKTRRVLFVEGKDFQILGKFARKLGADGVGSRRDFAVIPVEGFNPERNLKKGMESTLGTSVLAAALLDRDYRSDGECDHIAEKCREFCDEVRIYRRKEVENFLLVPIAINRAALQRLAEQARRSGQATPEAPDIAPALDEYCTSTKSYAMAQTAETRRQFERSRGSGEHSATLTQKTLEDFEEKWGDPEARLNIVSGKEALSEVNRFSQKTFSVTVTPMAIIDAMRNDEVPTEMMEIVEMLKSFSARSASN